MGDKSTIEWTDATWNPIRGCTRVSEGCRNCYAERVALRFSGAGQPYEGLVKISQGHPQWTGKVQFVEEHLRDPLRWRKPRRIFVNSMSDLFHEGISTPELAQIFAVMAIAEQHTFQVLTKRPKFMQAILNEERFIQEVAAWVEQLGYEISPCIGHRVAEVRDGEAFPLPNVWLGVSCENQETADERIPLLLQTPAAVRWVSAEPLLGPIDLDSEKAGGLHALGCGYEGGWRNCPDHEIGKTNCAGIDWVVVGGESGPGARPMHPDWARSLRDQCQAAGVPFFFKQWGRWSHQNTNHKPPGFVALSGYWKESQPCGWGSDFYGAQSIWDVGKKAAGRLLDGREWNEYPEVQR